MPRCPRRTLARIRSDTRQSPWLEALIARHGDKARKKVDALLRTKLPPALTEPVFYAIGGGWRAFAKAHMAAEQAPVPIVHGYSLGTKEVRRFAKTLWHLSPQKLAKLPGIATRRSATMAAAALVMDRVLKRLAPERVVFSALGVREGWLYQHPVRSRRD